MDFRTRYESAAFDLIAGHSHYEDVIEAVLRSEVSVWIATANLKGLMVQTRKRGRYASIVSELDRLARRGVELRILHASLPSRPFRSEFDRHPGLMKRLELRMCPRVHSKIILVDGALLYLGSANWTGAGLGAKGTDRRNFELGILSRDEQMIDQVQAYYERLWRGGPCGRCRMKRECEFPLDLLERSAV